MGTFVNLTRENIGTEHLCCAIADKKHQDGVDGKRAWLEERLGEGHVFRKLDAKGKVFIEYAPLETAWVPLEGENYLYIYCLWVSGRFQGEGYARQLLEYCIEDARARGKAGVCILSAKKKKPFLSDRKFFVKFGFETADTAGDGYELLSLSFDGTMPRFADSAKRMRTDSDELTIYYGVQCPFIANCVEQVRGYCGENNIALRLVAVDSLDKAKAVPGMFNNWAVFHHGAFVSTHLLNEGQLKKLLTK